MRGENISPELRQLLHHQKVTNFHVRAQLKRISEDEYVREEGRQEEKIANARKMIEENLPIEMIERCTGLSVEKIKQLLAMSH